MLIKALALSGAVLLAGALLPGQSLAQQARPAAAGTGEVVAWVHLRGGQHVTFRAAGKQFPVQIGTPLLRSDTIEVPAGEFVVVKLRNGYVVKIDEDTTLAVAQIVSLDAPPTKESLAAQLDRVLTSEERGRSERIAGAQARLAGADSVAPQSARAAPEPPAEPSSPAAKSNAPPPPPKTVSRAARESAAKPAETPPPRVEPAKPSSGISGISDTSSSTGLGGLGLSGTGLGGGGSGSSLGIGSGAGIGRGTGIGSGYGSGAGHLGGRAGSAPSVTLAQVEVQGPLNKDLVAIIARRHQSEVRFCYEKALQKNPLVAGRLVLKLVVDGHGAVTSVQAQSALSDPALGPCAAERARHWQFPASVAADSKPTIVVLTLPFDLAPPVR